MSTTVSNFTGSQAVTVYDDPTDPGRLLAGIRADDDQPLLIVPLGTWVAALLEYERSSGGVVVIRDER